jgi:hypothetical protein
MECFQDILSLSPGERWEQKIYAGIDTSDVFLLFWSRNAQKSEWVIREAEYALQRAQNAPLDQPLEIVPVLLEGPPPPAPPPSLKAIHFNDPIRHVIFAEECIAEARRDFDTSRFDQLGHNVDLLYETPFGMTASMKDGTALAILEKEVKWFPSLSEFRKIYDDNSAWTENKTHEAKWEFCGRAAAALRVHTDAVHTGKSGQTVYVDQYDLPKAGVDAARVPKPVYPKWSFVRRIALLVLYIPLLVFGATIIFDYYSTSDGDIADLFGASLFVLLGIGACMIVRFLFLRPTKVLK